MTNQIGHEEGRTLFAKYVDQYVKARPDYPQALYDFIVQASGLKKCTRMLEIGAGSGLATRRLIELGAEPVTVVEPDSRFAPGLRSLAKEFSVEFTLIEQPFETCAIEEGSYDLVAVATSYHWLDPATRLQKIANSLCDGGHVALWWNVFGDATRSDPFHDATIDLLSDLDSSPSGGDIPFALDVAARQREFRESCRFSELTHRRFSWSLELNAEQVGNLYATFSPISKLPEEEHSQLLNRLREIAEKEFDGRVIRNMTSIVYVAQKIS